MSGTRRKTLRSILSLLLLNAACVMTSRAEDLPSTAPLPNSVPPGIPAPGGGPDDGALQVPRAGAMASDSSDAAATHELAPPPVVTSDPLPESPSDYSATIARTPYNPRQPRFQSIRPQWGIELQWGYNPFGGNAITASQTGKLTAGSIQVEFQPAFLQGIGVLGLGPSVTIYPAIGGNFTSSPLSIWSAGGQVRYQMRWFHEQLIVPMVGYAYEYFRYNLADGNTGYIQSMGPMFGIYVYLNALDPDSAADFYSNYSGIRSYLVAEAKLLSGADDLVTLSGMGFYFGLRMEFE